MTQFSGFQQIAQPGARVGGIPRSVAGGAGQATDAALGIFTKRSSAPPSGTVLLCEETGEVSELRTDGTGLILPVKKTREQTRAERYSMKAVVNRLLPQSRTAKCYRQRAPHKHAIELKLGTECQRAYYNGLYTCGSVWTCPVCWAKITERRKVELQAAMATAKAMSWTVYLVTLTVPHGLGDDLPQMLDMMQAAANKLTSTRAGIRFREAISLRGSIRALEVTDGENGFHPHFHFLYFLDPDGYKVPPETVQRGLSLLWQDACVKVGLPRPSDRHGCRVDDGKKAAAYVSKGVWGLESEMTKGHTKTSKSKSGKSMADLLRAIIADPEDKRSAARFIAFSEAFRGRRQLVWSKGLKQTLSVVEKSDEQIAQEETEDISIVLTRFDEDMWRKIHKSRSETIVLDLAESSPDLLPAYLAKIGVYPHFIDYGQALWRGTGRAPTDAATGEAPSPRSGASDATLAPLADQE